MTVVDILADLGLATGVARSSLMYATVSAGHILGIALLLGPVILADLAMLGRIPSLGASAVLTLRRTARLGAVLSIATGVLLLSSKPDEYLQKSVFLTKLSMIALALANAGLFEWRARRPQDMLSLADKFQAAASIALWLPVVFLGRWIAFA